MPGLIGPDEVRAVADAATPTRPPVTARTRMPVSSAHVLWWMDELANRVRPPHWCISRTSTPSARGRSNAASAVCRTASGPSNPAI